MTSKEINQNNKTKKTGQINLFPLQPYMVCELADNLYLYLLIQLQGTTQIKDVPYFKTYRIEFYLLDWMDDYDLK